MAVEWAITIEGNDESERRLSSEVWIDNSRERRFEGRIGLSVDDGTNIGTVRQAESRGGDLHMLTAIMRGRLKRRAQAVLAAT